MSRRTREQKKSKEEFQKRSFSLKNFWEEKNPILLFLLVFGGLMSVFYVFWVSAFFKENIFNHVLHANAKIASALLNIFGYATATAGTDIYNSDLTISVRRGCDAIEPTALFVSAVLAFPAAIKSKFSGIAAGVAFLLSINMIRIISLFLTGIYAPSLFDFMHMEFWQVVFIMLALACWLMWIQWSMKYKIQPPNAVS